MKEIRWADGIARPNYVEPEFNRWLRMQSLERFNKELSELRAENKRLHIQIALVPKGFQFNLPMDENNMMTISPEECVAPPSLKVKTATA
jgi:hypothetical protein